MTDYDAIVVGGGIIGASILRPALRGRDCDACWSRGAGSGYGARAISGAMSAPGPPRPRGGARRRPRASRLSAIIAEESGGRIAPQALRTPLPGAAQGSWSGCCRRCARRALRRDPRSRADRGAVPRHGGLGRGRPLRTRGGAADFGGLCAASGPTRPCATGVRWPRPSPAAGSSQRDGRGPGRRHRHRAIRVAARGPRHRPGKRPRS